MRWSDERYVRLYVRDTVDWNVLPWQSRALWPLLLRKVDRIGLLELGKHGPRGLAAIVGLPEDVVIPGLAGLVDDGCVLLNGTSLVVKNFIEAQEVAASPAQRSREHRARLRVEDRDRARSTGNETKRDAAETKRSDTVTASNAASQSVTPCCAVPSHAEERESQKPSQGELIPMPKKPGIREQAAQVLGALNAARKRVRPSAGELKPTDTNLKHITKRLRSDSVEDCIRVIAYREQECRIGKKTTGGEDVFRYFNASAPFGDAGWGFVLPLLEEGNSGAAGAPGNAGKSLAQKAIDLEEAQRLAAEIRARGDQAKGGAA